MTYICKVKQGDLLQEEGATFIVNASNTLLELGSGVSASFKKACGIRLQTEMREKLQTLDNPLCKGDVVATSSCDATNFTYALHTAIMDYNQGVRGSDKLPTLSDITTVLTNIEYYLQWYADNHTLPLKLVLPLMGCGVGGLVPKDVLDIYHTFFQRDVPYTCEVIIYAYNAEHYKLAKSICTN